MTDVKKQIKDVSMTSYTCSIPATMQGTRNIRLETAHVCIIIQHRNVYSLRALCKDMM